jgi:hypothetical protein
LNYIFFKYGDVFIQIIIIIILQIIIELIRFIFIVN